MIFTFEKFLKGRENVICVDANFPAKLQISHWPGHSTPEEFFADTSTEMAFNLIESQKKDNYLKGIEVISNNHFDSDGVIAAFVLNNPDYAVANKKALINICTTGDFSEFTTEDALKADFVLNNLIDYDNSIFKELIKNKPFANAVQLMYEKGFELIHELIENIDKFEEHWKDNFEWYKKSEKSFETQQSVFSNYGDIRLTVLESNFEIHPVAKVSQSNYEIILSAVKADEGNLYQLEYKPFTWHATTRPQKIERKEFESLAAKLNQIEINKNGNWKVLGTDPIIDWDYKMHFSNEAFEQIPSKLKINEVENILFDYFFE